MMNQRVALVESEGMFVDSDGLYLLQTQGVDVATSRRLLALT
jgi:hypothetical protein